jgi:hypothetical protein
MGESERQVIAKRILAALYGDWESHSGSGLESVLQEGGWDKATFNEVREVLRDRYGFLTTSGNTVDITPAGILRAEESGVVPAATAEKHRAIRAYILAHLAALRDKEGRRAHDHHEKIVEGSPWEKFEILVDLRLLTKLGYVEAASSSSFRITDEGMREYRGTDYDDII